MIKTTDGARELLLTITNDGDGYETRVALARSIRRTSNDPLMVRTWTGAWLRHAQHGARKYEKQFGSPGASCFTVTDILCAAAELAEYYEQDQIEREQAK